MSEEYFFLDYVWDSSHMRVLQYLIQGRDFDYTLTDMLNAEVSWGTLNVLIPKFLELGLIVKTRKIGRATLYRINKDNVAVKQLIELYRQLVLEKLNNLEEQATKKVEVPA